MRRPETLGARMLTEHRLVQWHGNGVTVRSFLTGTKEEGLVIATTNRAFDPLPETMPGKGMHRIDDCAAPWLAAYALDAGRKLGMSARGRRRQ